MFSQGQNDSNLDRQIAIEAQDRELAKVLQEQERARARKAKEKARQKAALQQQQATKASSFFFLNWIWFDLIIAIQTNSSLNFNPI